MLMPYIDRDWIASLPPGIDVPIAALIGLPLYVCATGSTPLAAMLLVQGLSPGAVLALLLTGPATNVTTFGVLAKLHGGRTAVLFVVSMWLGAMGLGYLVNAFMPVLQVKALDAAAHDHSGLATIALVALGGVFLVSLLRQGVRPFLERLYDSPANLVPGEAAACGDAHEHGHHHGHHHHAHAASGTLFTPLAQTPLAPPRPGDDGTPGCCKH
jgi:hypothetical protein